MAKNKRKHYKKRNKSYPPLSKLDRFIYSFIQISSTVLTLGGIYGLLDIQSLLFLKDENVLAFYTYDSIAAHIPYAIAIISVYGFLLSLTGSGKPLFGDKKHDYYNTTKYKFVLPVFDKRYKDITLTKKNIVKWLTRTIVVIFILILTSLLSFSNLCKRYEFTENEIKKLNFYNKTIETYSYDDIESYSPCISRHKIGRYGSGSLFVGFEILLKNGERLSPDHFIGLRDIKSLYTIDSLIDDGKKKVDYHNFENFLNTRKSLSVNEKEMLNDIFEQ